MAGMDRRNDLQGRSKRHKPGPKVYLNSKVYRTGVLYQSSKMVDFHPASGGRVTVNAGSTSLVEIAKLGADEGCPLWIPIRLSAQVREFSCWQSHLCPSVADRSADQMPRGCYLYRWRGESTCSTTPERLGRLPFVHWNWKPL